MKTSVKTLEQRSCEHMRSLGITSKERLQHQLQEIFEKAEHQDSALPMVSRGTQYLYPWMPLQLQILLLCYCPFLVA